MNLKTRLETIHVVDYQEFERFVCELYGVKDYSFPQSAECNNDTDHLFSIGENDGDEWMLEPIAEFVTGKTEFCRPEYLLTDMVSRGVLPAGKYLIRVCW